MSAKPSDVIRARKSLGQNFLVDRQVALRIVKAVAPLSTDIVLEIGPGTGALTQLLADRAGFVVAIEIDPRLVYELGSKIQSDRLLIVEADAMAVDLSAVLDQAAEMWKAPAEQKMAARVRVVANLPYYISTPIIERLFRLKDKIYDLTLMLQREVVERIISPPGTRQRGYLSVFVQYHCFARKLFVVPPTAFRPVPKVHSAIVNLKVEHDRLLLPEQEEGFFKFVRAAFSQKRKTILNNLNSPVLFADRSKLEEALYQAGIDPKRRAESLTLEEFRNLYITVASLL
jgi:16S rRNA (adenine1518-N6/adenine1519-N6)-dimethyltransferase